jgi:hypothetical protein
MESLYIDDPELGRIPLIADDDTAEEKAAKQQIVDEALAQIGYTGEDETQT